MVSDSSSFLSSGSVTMTVCNIPKKNEKNNIQSLNTTNVRSIISLKLVAADESGKAWKILIP